METSEQNGLDQHASRLRAAGLPASQLNGNGNGAAHAAAEDEMLSVIGSGILVTGNIDADVDLHIEGKVVGDVRCATLILGERGAVTGNIFADRVRVSGAVEGGVETIDLAIEASARVKGDVTYSRLRIANGGVIAGTMIHRPVEDTGRPVPQAETRPAQPAPPSRVHYIE